MMSTPVTAYFRNIYDNVKSVLIGMRITLKYCFQKTVTVQYPEQQLSFAPRYRGIHEFEAEKCIACDLCAKACPVDCIYIDKSGPRRIDKKTGTVNPGDPKNGELLRFAIDYSKCLFCALCTEPCPTDCIHMGKLHDLSSYTPRGRGGGVRGAGQEGPAHADPALDGAQRRQDPVGEGRVRAREGRQAGHQSRRHPSREVRGRDRRFRGRDGCRPRAHPIFFRNSAIRSIPLSICSMLVAKLRRTCVSNPLSLPGTTATWVCSSRAAAKLTASVIFAPPALLPKYALTLGKQ